MTRPNLRPKALRRFELIVFGVAAGQPRARASTIRMGNVIQAKIHQDDKPRKKAPWIIQWKSDVKTAAVDALKSGLAVMATDERPIRVDITFFFPRKKEYMRKCDVEQKAGAYRPGPIPFLSKPDRDNLDKAVLDTLTNVLWTDDCRVFSGQIEKFYCSIPGYMTPMDRPHALITITHYATAKEERDHHDTDGNDKDGAEK
jgi:Holliday junction resolvase RusA-like endonuclease